LLTFPAAFGFLVLARPIIGALLQHGQFSPLAADTTGRALAGISLGLIGYSIYLFALRGFYAHQDTRTPFIINCVQNTINIALAFILVQRFDVLGLGVAFAVSYIVSAVATLYLLRVKVPGFPATQLLVSLARILVAAAVMAVIVFLVVKPVGSNHGGGAVAKIAVGGLAGTLTYIGALTLLKAPEIEQLKSLGSRLRSNR
jgi:putative peptidoglycan lipid II flippase